MTTGASRADTVAVVGAAAGIGAATARRLVMDGRRVITVDARDADVTCDLGTEAGRREAGAGNGAHVATPHAAVLGGTR